MDPLGSNPFDSPETTAYLLLEVRGRARFLSNQVDQRICVLNERLDGEIIKRNRENSSVHKNLNCASLTTEPLDFQNALIS